MEPARPSVRSILHGRSVVGIRSLRLGSAQPSLAATRYSIFYGPAFASHWIRAHYLFCGTVICRHSSWPVSLELHRLVHPSISTRIPARSRGRLAWFIYRCTEGPFITSPVHRHARFDSIICRGLVLTCVIFI